MIRFLAPALVLLLALPAVAEVHKLRLEDMGLARTLQRYHTGATLDLHFAGRKSEVPTAARLRLELDPAVAEGQVRQIEIRVNQEPVATIRPGKEPEHEVTIDPMLLSDRNLLSLRMIPMTDGPCGDVTQGLWSVVKGGTLEFEGTPLPLPNDLSILPLPFFDRGFDRSATIPVVFATPPSPGTVQAAALFAGAIGVDGGISVRFPVHVGELPDDHAIVFLDSAEGAAALGLPAPEGATLRMVDRPGEGATGHKLLVLAGRTQAELERAVRRFAADTAGLHGEVVLVEEQEMAPARQPYDAPRWARLDEALTFGRIADPAELVQSGTTGGSIPVRFRLPPDLFAWPSEWIDLDLDYRGTLPEGIAPPRLDVEMNGSFVGTLPVIDPMSAGPQHARLRIHRDVVRGYNEILVHVTWPEEARSCTAGASADGARIELLPTSTLHVHELPHFARMPDVAGFVDDGFPFTRLADLSETAFILPAEPKPQEIATVLSVVAHFGAITGVPGGRLTVLGAEEVPRQLDKDLILVGTVEDHALLRRWSARFPLAFTGAGPRLQLPEQANPILSLLAGRPEARDLERARPVLVRAAHPAAVMAMESPLAKSRTVVAVTAGTLEDLPGVAEMRGFAESRTRVGDLLLLDQGQRWAFRIGPTWNQGKIDRFTEIRWFLGNHWIALVPMLLVGALACAWMMRGSLERRAARRLAPSSEAPA